MDLTAEEKRIVLFLRNRAEYARAKAESKRELNHPITNESARSYESTAVWLDGAADDIENRTATWNAFSKETV